MTPDQSLLEEAREEAAKWFGEVEKDVNAARALIVVEASRSVFHSQQAAEKSFLTVHQISFRKAHELADLAAQCPPSDARLESLLGLAESL